MHGIYDVNGLVKAFGGRQGLIEKLRRGAGEEAKIKTVDKWVERGSIPSDILIKCQIASDKLGLGISITDYIISEEKKK